MCSSDLPNYQCPPPDLVNGAKEYEVEKILDSWKFGRKQKLQYLVKWKGYPDLENQWVNKDDIFGDEALWKFKQSNPMSEVHIGGVHEPHIPQLPTPAKYMSSPTESTIEDAILPTYVANATKDQGHQESC